MTEFADLYFVTICTQGVACFFGELARGTMQMSAAGQIVAEEWQKTEQIQPNVTLDEWIIMPNHVHGIVTLHTSGAETSRPNSLDDIIDTYKSSCTKRIQAAGFQDFAWQPRYYDHCICDEQALLNVRQYIRDNPLQWENDFNHQPAAEK